ncbi:MAG: HIT family protein [Gemmataceae bacterium]
MSVQDCPFCKKLADLPALREEDVVWSFPLGVAFLGPWQFYQGYCVLASRKHARELFDLTDEERKTYLEEMCLLARAIHHAFQPLKLNYELLGNQVSHLHWHVFPRYGEDPDRLSPVWLNLARAEQSPTIRETLERGSLPREEIRARIRQSLVALGAPSG